MRPGPAAVCLGEVMHRRSTPEHHAFRYAVNQVWVDPERPGDLCAAHPAWSATRPAPAWFRPVDYGDGHRTGPAPLIRDEVAATMGTRPAGPIRLLTQVRTWGWLFNPISVYVVWNSAYEDPIAAVVEVTNTPWKERHRYAVTLESCDRGFQATFDKVLHVSPFLDENHRYELVLSERIDVLSVAIDVFAPDALPGSPVLETRLKVRRLPADRANLSAALRRNPLPTHRVSTAIHAQAARLWRKGVPFVAHPPTAEVER